MSGKTIFEPYFKAYFAIAEKLETNTADMRKVYSKYNQAINSIITIEEFEEFMESFTKTIEKQVDYIVKMLKNNVININGEYKNS